MNRKMLRVVVDDHDSLERQSVQHFDRRTSNKSHIFMLSLILTNPTRTLKPNRKKIMYSNCEIAMMIAILN